MATSKQHLCDICMNQHLTQNAIVHCPECEEKFCEKCKIYHEIAKATKNHEVMPIEHFLKLPKFVQDINLNCTEHDESFVLYCDEHDKPCCAYCLHNAHTRYLETTLSDLMTNLTNIIEYRSENLQDLVKQKTRCKMKIKTTKEAFNAYLDELEADLLDKLQKTFTENEFQIQNMLKDIELRKSNICEMQENVTIVKSVCFSISNFHGHA
ncbi:TRIM1 [Mytilus coruscus]|uniref:TRIM1 n=1 Tax=Mytilus coruscus TaxID=42192 RepID=A0A6J8F301_MYTCO|nr:TRIM1 [Mytilus coruscus]